jgi:hypothetical protein
MNLSQEFNRQVRNLVKKGYPQLSGIPETDFINLIEPLKSKLDTLDLSDIDFQAGYLPFVIVVKNDLIATDRAMSLVEKDGKSGITKLFPHQPTDFSIISTVSIPDSKIYLLIDIDRGKENINQPPIKAMENIVEKGRLPLTIDEGVAIVTHYPEFLVKNNCFSLLASRHEGDQRVPAIWINANKNPNLGWCWNGNPHTWLGSASCKDRLC